MNKRLAFLTLLLVFLTLGCNMMTMGNTPTAKVEEVLKQYNNHDDLIVMELGDYLNSLDLDNDMKESYHEIYLRQYSDMTWEVKNEVIDGDKATVTVQLKVYDYYRSESLANNYINSNQEEFFDEQGNFSAIKAFQHRINELKNTNDKVEHQVDFNLTKIDDKWVVDNLSSEVLERIHGTYSY